MTETGKIVVLCGMISKQHDASRHLSRKCSNGHDNKSKYCITAIATRKHMRESVFFEPGDKLAFIHNNDRTLELILHYNSSFQSCILNLIIYRIFPFRLL